MKKVLLPLLMIVLLLASAVPALAAGPQPEKGKGRAPLSLVGTITGIDGTTITVKVMAGNRLVKSVIGQEVEVRTNQWTRFLTRVEGETAAPITLADLVTGQNVSLNGKITTKEDGAKIWTATRVTVGPKLVHLP